jgi:hypothetical protein
MLVQAEVWEKFLETPLAVLEEHGLDQRAINALEVRYGLYIGSIQHLQEKEIFKTLPGISFVMAGRLKGALSSYYRQLIGS